MHAVRTERRKVRYLIIPEEDVQRIEAARKRLHELVEGTSVQTFLYTGVTDAMWYIAHRRYPIVEKDGSQICDFENGGGI